MSFYNTLDIYDTSEYVVKIKGDNFSILSRMYNNEDEESIKLDREEYDTTARYVLAKAGYEDADIAGMTIGLNIASKEEGFDYDLYFRCHSKLWVKQSTLIVEQGEIFNEHPLYYLRINATCQQFEEFHETYDIKEGDLMYLAPEDRIAIW